MSVHVNSGGEYAGLHRRTRRKLREKAAAWLLRILATTSDDEEIAAQDSAR